MSLDLSSLDISPLNEILDFYRSQGISGKHIEHLRQVQYVHANNIAIPSIGLDAERIGSDMRQVQEDISVRAQKSLLNSRNWLKDLFDSAEQMLAERMPNIDQDAIVYAENILSDLKFCLLVKTALSPETAIKNSSIEDVGRAKHREFVKNEDREGAVNWLSHVLSVKRVAGQEYAQVLGLDTPYDGLAQAEWCHGFDSKTLDFRMDQILDGLLPLRQFMREKVEPSHVAHKQLLISADQQRLLFRSILCDLGFDFTRGDFHESTMAAVEGGFPGEVRLLVSEFSDNPTLSEFATKLRLIMHEAAGHGIALQNTPEEMRQTPLGGFFGMPYHEAVALLHDRVLMNRSSFLNYVSNKSMHLFGDTGISGAELVEERMTIKDSLLRREADEISFHSHAAIRHFIEKPLINQQLDDLDVERFSKILGKDHPIVNSRNFEVGDLEQVWNAFYSYYFKQVPSMPSKGFMQDVQIFVGKWSYHAAYPMGHNIAADIWEKLQSQHPEIDEDIEKGNFTNFNNWMRNNIFAQPSFQNINFLFSGDAEVQTLIRHEYKRAASYLNEYIPTPDCESDDQMEWTYQL